MAKDGRKTAASILAKLGAEVGEVASKAAGVATAAAVVALTASTLPDKITTALGLTKPPVPVVKELPDRIRVLTDSLNAAARTIGEIESEIQVRQQLVAELKRDADIANNLRQLNKEQVDAVAQVLRSQIDREQKEGFWASQGIAFFYTILGVLLAEAFRWGSRWWNKRKEATPSVSGDK